MNSNEPTLLQQLDGPPGLLDALFTPFRILYIGHLHVLLWLLILPVGMGFLGYELMIETAPLVAKAASTHDVSPHIAGWCYLTATGLIWLLISLLIISSIGCATTAVVLNGRNVFTLVLCDLPSGFILSFQTICLGAVTVVYYLAAPVLMLLIYETWLSDLTLGAPLIGIFSLFAVVTFFCLVRIFPVLISPFVASALGKMDRYLALFYAARLTKDRMPFILLVICGTALCAAGANLLFHDGNFSLVRMSRHEITVLAALIWYCISSLAGIAVLGCLWLVKEESENNVTTNEYE